ncbi:hypothetical protein D3C76_1679810 [compost metagenome]
MKLSKLKKLFGSAMELLLLNSSVDLKALTMTTYGGKSTTNTPISSEKYLITSVKRNLEYVISICPLPGLELVAVLTVR